MFKSNAIRDVDFTGVIYVMDQASKAGYRPSDRSWLNLGQGQPETGALPGGLARPTNLTFNPDEIEYAPIAGSKALRQRVAEYYNKTYRNGMPSQYSYENVCIAPGGRAALTRIAASMSNINLGHFLPDYTAYQELLTNFRLFNPIPILLDPNKGYEFETEQLKTEILGRGLGALLISNPCNPTGKCISDLKGWVQTASELDCTMIFDEFYSHYLWKTPASGQSNSAARFIEDVEASPTLIVNGLTKNWRLPGWRISWVLAPKPIIKSIASAGSFLDGGASHPLQSAAIQILDQTEANPEEWVRLQEHFAAKRRILLEGLRGAGIQVNHEPEGTFYIWAYMGELAEHLNDGMKFFRASLDEKVICIPGEFFDVDPGGRRASRVSRFKKYMRFSFGAPTEVLEEAVSRIKTLTSQKG